MANKPKLILWGVCVSMGHAGSGPGGGLSRRVVEAATAVIVAVVVASGVVAVGMVTRDDQQNIAGPGRDDTPSEEPDEPNVDLTTHDVTPEPEEDEPSEQPADEPEDGPTGQFRPEVTSVELSVDQPEYTGPCPVTLTFSARVTTNTGPLRADVEWRNADGTEVAGQFVQFGGPGPGKTPDAQGATITHDVEVADDNTIQRTAVAIDPNEVASNTVEATVTCTPSPENTTPSAEITKGGDDFDADAALCHRLNFDATISVPQDMTVTYEWLRSDGATGPPPDPLVFSDGGAQTQSIPGQTWNLGDHDGEYGYRIHITSPSDVTSGLVAYAVDGCSEPAT